MGIASFLHSSMCICLRIDKQHADTYEKHAITFKYLSFANFVIKIKVIYNIHVGSRKVGLNCISFYIVMKSV